MKNLKLLMLLACISLLAMSCGDDEEPNEMVYDGQNLALTSGIYQTYGDNGNGSYDWDISLFGEGVTIDANGNISGEGPYLYIDLNTGSETGLVASSYTYSNGERMAGNFVDGSVGLNFSTDTEINGGVLQILSVSSTSINLTFNLTDVTGKDIIGQYNGTITLNQ